MNEKNLERIKRTILQQLNIHAVVTSYKIAKSQYSQYYHFTPSYLVTWQTAVCPYSGEIVQNNEDDIYSIYLRGERHSYNRASLLLTTKNALEQRDHLLDDSRMNGNQNYYRKKGLIDTEKRASFIYVESAENAGINITNYSCKVFYNEDKKALEWVFKKNSYVHFAIGQKNTAYKVLKKGDVPTDIFGCVGLNSKTITSDATFVVFEEGKSIADFLMQENMQQFSKITQLPRILSAFLYSENLRHYEIGFKAYIALMSEFPQFELLYKMGCLNLFRSACERIVSCKSIKQMRESVKDISKLIDDHATKGKQTLRIPSYIAEYLSDKNADLKEYLTWCDIYELTHISKENFEEIVLSIPFMNYLCEYVTFSETAPERLSLLPLLLRYGYDISKLLRYLYKEKTPAGILKDYLEMTEYLGGEIVLYPEDLKKRHDDLSVLKKEKDNEETNKTITQIAERVEAAIAKTLEEEERFTVVMPKTVADFFDEGNRMNNCVGHYSNKVAKGDCVIFFVRRKEEPDEGFITAEYRCASESMGQFFYKNNCPVEDSKAISFGRKICGLIQKAIK